MSLDSLGAAVQGAVIGATLGAPQRGNANFRKLNYYEPIPLRMAPSEALDAWLVGAKALREGGMPEGYTESLQRHWTYVSHESAFGQANAARGLRGGLCGHFQNPISTGAQALGRAVFWGLAFSGDPTLAATWAAADAGFDHDGEGVWMASATAVLASLAKEGASVVGLLRAAGAVLPKASVGHRVIQQVAYSLNNGQDVLAAYERLPMILPTRDPHLAPLNFGFLLLSLLYGKGDFGTTVRIAAGCGGSADQTTLAAGAIAARLNPAGMEEWAEPLGDDYVGGHGLRDLDPPRTIGFSGDTLDSFVEVIVSVARPKLAVDIAPLPEPVLEPVAEPIEEPTQGQSEGTGEATAVETVAQPEGDPVPASEAHAEAPDQPAAEPAPVTADPAPALTVVTPNDSAALVTAELGLLAQELGRPPNSMAFGYEGLRLTVEYVDGVVAHPGKSQRLVATFGNSGEQELTINPIFMGPEGWAVASKFASFRLRAGESTSFGVVLQPPAGADLPASAKATLEFDGKAAILPVFGPEKWYVVGPIPNIEGTGFDTPGRPEDAQTLGETFAGRSHMPVRWTERGFPGVIFDLEPVYASGPGIVYIWTKFRMPSEGRYRLVVAASTGALAWIDKRQLVKYHDEHVPVPRAIQPYLAEFQATGDHVLLIKVLRNLTPLAPIVVYFVGEDGRIVRPATFYPMPQ